LPEAGIIVEVSLLQVKNIMKPWRKEKVRTIRII